MSASIWPRLAPPATFLSCCKDSSAPRPTRGRRAGLGRVAGRQVQQLTERNVMLS
jgi:hypothetical protein